MIRALFTALLVLHGLIHLIGFAREWRLTQEGHLLGKTVFTMSEDSLRLIGIAWLIVSLLFLLASIAYYMQKNWFWIPASIALVLSQALIVLYWQDARWATIGNMVILIAVIFSVASLRFKSAAQAETNNLVHSASDDRFEITEEMIAELPPIIQDWLKKAHIIGSYMPSSIYVKQKGTMRTAKESKWMPFEAEQTFTINPPGFIWTASIHTPFMIDIVGRDKYKNGKGNMIIKAASIISMANSAGKEIDQGTMIRYMAEIAWFPQAALSEYLHWEQIDAKNARMTMTYGEVTASGIYTFNNDGFPVNFEALRYGDFKGKLSKEIWSVNTTRFAYFDGITVGNSSEVTWKLKEGDFTWLRLTLTDVEYD